MAPSARTRSVEAGVSELALCSETLCVLRAFNAATADQTAGPGESGRVWLLHLMQAQMKVMTNEFLPYQ